MSSAGVGLHLTMYCRVECCWCSRRILTRLSSVGQQVVSICRLGCVAQLVYVRLRFWGEEFPQCAGTLFGR